MQTFIMRRLLHAAVVVFFALSAVFFMLQLSGDPARLMMPMDTSQKDIEEFRRRLGFDRPLPVQYAEFMLRAATGDFGESLRQKRPATEVVLERLPATLELAGLSFLLSLVIAVPAGILSAAWRGTVWDRFVVLLTVVGQALPGFWLGLLLIVLFSVELKWLPTGGRGTPEQLIMPAVTLAAFTAARFTRVTRSSMLDVLGQDYIRTARGKGLSGWTILWTHALRNASITLITVAGLTLGRALGGAVIVEQVFSWPGVGRTVVQALENRDFPVVMFGVFVFALTFTLINLLVDLLYAWVNPQVRLE